MVARYGLLTRVNELQQPCRWGIVLLGSFRLSGLLDRFKHCVAATTVSELLRSKGEKLPVVALQIQHAVFLTHWVASCGLSRILAYRAVFGAPLAGVGITTSVEEKIAVIVELPAPVGPLRRRHEKHLSSQRLTESFLRQRFGSLWKIGGLGCGADS